MEKIYNDVDHSEKKFIKYERVLYSCGYEYSDYMEKTIPGSVYDNVLFLKRFIEIEKKCDAGSFLSSIKVKRP